MARRRRAFSSHYCSSAILPVDLVCFEERTSSNFFNFAQNRRRWFSELKSGVSLVASDADLLRTLSLLPTASVGSFSEPSDLKLNGESMVLMAKVPGFFQIWRACSPTSVFLLFVVDRVLLPVYNRSSTHQSLPSSAASTVWTTSHHALHSHAARISLGLHVSSTAWTTSHHALHSLAARISLGSHVSSVRRRHGRHVAELGQMLWKKLISYWAWPINDFINFSLMGSFGNWPSWRFCLASPSLIVYLHHPSDNLTCCLHRHLAPPPLLVPSASSSARVGDSTKVRSLPSSSWQKERIIMSLYVSLRTAKLKRLYLDNCSPPRYQISSCRGQREFVPPPRYQNSSCRGQREIACPLPRYQNSSCRGQREIACPPPRYQISFCWGQERPFPSSSFSKERTFICERCFSEASLSVISKGSSKRCVVAFDYVAEFWIGSYALVAESISNIRSLLVLFVVHGISSLIASNVVKARRHHDDLYCLRIEIAFIYRIIYCFVVFCLAFVAALLLILMNFLAVTSFSFNGE